MRLVCYCRHFEPLYATLQVAELRMLWQVESETGSQLMFDDITAGLANMSVRRKDLEKELDSHVTEVSMIC